LLRDPRREKKKNQADEHSGDYFLPFVTLFNAPAGGESEAGEGYGYRREENRERLNRVR